MADVVPLSNSTFDGTSRVFAFVFRDEDKIKRLTVPVPIPLKISAKEFAWRLINEHDIPCYLEPELITAFDAFLKKSLRDLYDKMADQALDEVLESPQLANDYVTSWANTFTQEHSKYCTTSDVSENVAFAEMYHSLIHSAALEILLQLENTYALAVEGLLSHRDAAINSVQEKNRKQLEEAISNIGLSNTDRDVSNLAARHCEESQMLETYWSSELSQLQEMQKREYREWVIKVHEDTTNGGTDYSSNTGSFFKTRSVSTLSNVPSPEEYPAEPEQRMEESFTIHLGAQMKTMHNVRLIGGDVLDLCQHKVPPGGSVLSQPHRIQTALSLYSESLAGLVLLVDNRLNTYSGIMKDFSAICQQSTDFHFPDLDQQLCLIQQNMEQKSRTKSVASVTSDSTHHEATEDTALKTLTLDAGDFYVTRHSNLAEAQVVLHLVVDDSVKSASLNSRNPCVVGLRHVLHTAVRYNITTLTLPLLLFHEMTEEMTNNWCVKRAELVLKCVKGFMMECTSWSGVDSLNVQFMVPKGISVDMFHTITSMMPSIFRISTPLDLKSSNNR